MNLDDLSATTIEALNQARVRTAKMLDMQRSLEMVDMRVSLYDVFPGDSCETLDRNFQRTCQLSSALRKIDAEIAKRAGAPQ